MTLEQFKQQQAELKKLVKDSIEKERQRLKLERAFLKSVQFGSVDAAQKPYRDAVLAKALEDLSRYNV